MDYEPCLRGEVWSINVIIGTEQPQQMYIGTQARTDQLLVDPHSIVAAAN
jgi:hypothetical protein